MKDIEALVETVDFLRACSTAHGKPHKKAFDRQVDWEAVEEATRLIAEVNERIMRELEGRHVVSSV